MKFRKKPVVIDAFQMTEARRWDNSEWPDWLHEAWNRPAGEVGALFIDPWDPTGARLLIGTLEGPLGVSWEAWIIRGVERELYCCQPSIFAATYEPVEDDAVLVTA